MNRLLTAEYPLLLGSASPRRREILTTLQIPHRVLAPEVDEKELPGEDVDAYLARIAAAKVDAVRARAAREGVDAAVVLAADTTVEEGGRILGKPADVGEALRVIQSLSGKTHRVSTRFVLAPLAPGAPPLHGETVTTRVRFRRIEDAEARAYAETGEGFDRAGGYAVQGLASAFVERIEGSFTNVVGLPACELVMSLRALGLL